ncbi:DUF3887 domain-containing protein [Escherichia albertii]|uniref:DUF3887 domain-containing protein n=1 Tax=Escherichia albertii TaxID=208962 RepID=UPI000A85F562|nr:DUF3887 domain-containing protein [Escherichia albertii]MCQ8910532.1 DUF3887 domain-containing protein [Escherichia albertii]MCQ8920906.1 DUF3887 domain-containing protein [Escherichia albertii]MCQ8938864.1 DUF3887 domain-containing protein [Escherichia albertii]MCQ8950433.1 DUF3887 domain-containing protein [Escherichia albertii]MCQ8977394.1 DUF3887 domain-containing protein [Escherichia albertii]
MKIKVGIVIVAVVAFMFFGKDISHNVIKVDADIRKIAQDKVIIIQKLYNQNEVDKIYSDTSSEFKKATSEEVFISIMKEKKQIFGKLNKIDLLASNVINHNVVVLTYRSTYEHYSLIEAFEFTKENKGELYLSVFYADEEGKLGEVIKL